MQRRPAESYVCKVNVVKECICKSGSLNCVDGHDFDNEETVIRHLAKYSIKVGFVYEREF